MAEQFGSPEERLRGAKQELSKSLLADPSVIGVGTAREPSGVYKILVYVVNDAVSARLPRVINGFKVDIRLANPVREQLRLT
jgi:hypothetical protein